MGLLPANPRDQKLMAVIVVAVAISALYFNFLWSPKSQELDASQAHVDSLVVMNQRAKSELAQGKTQELKAEAERFASDLEVMRRLVPTGNEVPALLEQVSTAARRVGLEIADVQPLPLLQGDQYDAYKYRLSVRGNYHEIGVLLANIGSLQRIVAPINLTLAPVSQPGGARSSVRKQPVEARFEIQTYVARTTPTPAKPALPGTGE
ncbi:MAG TPA: type 4a pilus biogenesis protein PilO [Gemmatimonadaceae bacterium]|nr:type 4a pilus biogenesis protein PilO [Gemmatimonadaceae bacterium]